MLNCVGSADAQGFAADCALANLLDQPRGVAVDDAGVLVDCRNECIRGPPALN